ncbi:MAG TPA: alpha/beta hydrolase [Acidimicrobiia bacterium]|nr:alpha/beta hydrolase [Acidimicrobiia bacterium]
MKKGKVGRFKSEEARAEFLRRYDDVLTYWPVASEELDVDTEFGTTHVRRSGDPGRTPLVLVHPNLGTSLAWWRLVEPLAHSHQVLALDTIGALGRSVQTKPIVDPSDLADWLGEVISELDLDSPHLIGFSEGGWVVMSSALGSGPIRSLVAIEPGGIAKISKRFLGAMLVAGVKAQFDDTALQKFAERISPGVEFAPGEMETVLYGGKNFKPALPFPRRFTDEDLARVDVPTLLYMGAKTELYDPVKAAERAERLMPNVETVIVPHAQHGLPFQYPDFTTKTILDFIDRVEG